MYEQLRKRLRDPDQWVRVETLRILAMLEETRALSDIAEVFKNDPEPGVRHVAQWAGRLIYAAQRQQGEAPHSPVHNPHEERLIDSLIDKGKTYNSMQAELLEQELTETLRTEKTIATSPPPLIPSVGTRAPHRPHISDLNELLEAGLSPDFFED